jgi:hypothetical protein
LSVVVVIVRIAVLVGALGATLVILTEVIPPVLSDRLGVAGLSGLTGSARALGVGNGGKIKR